jgi:hypothetical protein
LKSSANGFHANLLEATKKDMAGNPIARKDAARLRKSKRVGPKCCAPKKTRGSSGLTPAES